MYLEYAQHIKSDPLGTYFLLPWVGINPKISLGQVPLPDEDDAKGNAKARKPKQSIRNVVSARATLTGYILCEILNLTVAINNGMLDNPNYIIAFQEIEDGNSYILYQLPKIYMDGLYSDFQYFVKGQYSRISPKAKELILNNSGLTNTTSKLNGNLVRDSRLTFLTPTPEIKAQIAEHLQIDVDSITELFDKPWDECFVDLSSEFGMNLDTLPQSEGYYARTTMRGIDYTPW